MQHDRPLLLRLGSAFVAGLVLAVLAQPLTARPSWAGPRVLYLATAQPNNLTRETSAVMTAVFKAKVETASEGALKVELFPDSQLGGNRELAGLVQKNVIQTAIISVGGLAPLYPPIAVIEMPFAYASPQSAYQVLDGPFGHRLSDAITQRTSLTVLGYGDPGGFFVLTNGKRPIHSPQDMDGVRIRSIPGFQVLDAMISGMGGVPVRVSSREEYSALEEGVVDGQTNPVPVIVSRHYDMVQRYLTLTNHLYVPYVWVINASVMESLPLEQRQIVTDAAREAIAASRVKSREIEGSDFGLSTLRRRLEVYTPTPEERAAFKAASQPKVAQTIAETLGDEGTSLLAEFQAAIAEAEATPATPQNQP